MKKNTLAKWMLAGAAMVVAFACQSKKSPDDLNDNSSCPCSGHSTLVVPVVETKVEEVVATGQDKTSDEVSTYVIEIMDSVETPVDSSKNETTAVTEEAAPEVVIAPTSVPVLEEVKAGSTTLNTAPVQSNLDQAADATDSTIYVNTTATATSP